ncbi:MAG TPA: VTT domain-containing protein [Candidatus Nanoarchaeia archaeon]|nr:VTT domain-containing protein [Candidatus Nanoarchaeia archaeon]
MKEIETISQGINIIKHHGYFIIFLLMVIEGPIVSAAAAFASSLGYFNLYIIFVLSFFGCFIPDLIYFSIGKTGNKSLIKKLKRKYGEKRIEKLVRKLHKNKRKTLVAVKLTPFASVPGLILSGLMGIRYKSFIMISMITTFFISAVFVTTGYYFGVMFDTLINYFNITIGVVVLAIVLSIFYPYLIKKIKEIKRLF